MRSTGDALAALLAAGVLCGCAATAPATPTGRAEPPPRPRRVEWDADGAKIRCPNGAAVTVPRVLARDLRPEGADGLAIVPPGSPPGGALLVTNEAQPFVATPARGNQLPPTWARLHKLASGRDPARVHADLRLDATSVRADYTEEDAPDQTWRFVYVQSGQCRIAALDLLRPGVPPRFTPLVVDMSIPPSFFESR
jgi:hypothetical protein